MRTQFFDFYKLSHFFLLTSLILYSSARILLRQGNGRIWNRKWLRVGQASLLASLALPVVVFVFPAELPHISLPSFWPPHLIQDRDSDVVSSQVTRGGKVELKQITPPHSKAIALRRFARTIANPDFFWLFFLAIGFCWGTAKAIVGLKYVRNLLARCTPFKKVGRVSLLISDEDNVPFATRGLYRIYVVVPCHLLGSRNYLKLAIKHEIQHHRQGDTLWMFFIELLKVFFFLNPAIHRWSREISESQELACDEVLLTQKKVAAYDYGGCLIYVAESALPKRLGLFGTAGMGCGSSGPNSLLSRRIQMLTSYNVASSRFKFGILVLSISVGLVGAVAGAASILGKNPDPETQSSLGTAQTYPAIQQIAETALRNGIAQAKAGGGFAVITDVSTGQILAAVHVKNEKSKMVNDSSRSRFLKIALSPLSVAKPLVVAEAIDKGGVGPQDILSCGNGTYKVGETTYEDWDAFGDISVAKVIAQSSNIGVIKIANAFGGNRLATLLPDFGFGSQSVAPRYPNANSGTILAAKSLPEEILGATLAIGEQGWIATPLEIVQAYAALANGGRLLEPQPYDRNLKPGKERQVISRDTSKIMRALLRAAVTDGTGRKAATPSYTTAGKTGSSPKNFNQNGITGLASFAGFAPAEEPRIAIFVGIENPFHVHGGEVAAPVFSAMVEASLKELGVPSGI